MRNLALIPILGFGLCGAGAAVAAETLADELANGFYSRINLLGYDLYQDVEQSLLNPGNVLGIAHNEAELQFRPDFNLKWKKFEFDLKPRFQTSRASVVYTGPVARALRRDFPFVYQGIVRFLADESRDSSFVNEGTVRFLAGERLVLSYGRENLQWGPSALLSPSNPFNANNGRVNPNLELPGLDYARAVWVVSPALTASVIVNTGKGRLDAGQRYRKASALKMDYTSDGAFFSVIASKADDERVRLGGFAGWNVSDALSVRAEVSAAGNGADDRLGTRRRDRQLLLGGSYTLESGPTLSAEFFWNNDGCADAPIQVCVLLRGTLLDPVRPLVRRRYAMLQLVKTEIAGKLNVYARATRNLDDHSSQLTVNLEYELGQHWQLYVIPTWYHGTRESEFGSLLNRSLFAGASYTF